RRGERADESPHGAQVRQASSPRRRKLVQGVRSRALASGGLRPAYARRSFDERKTVRLQPSVIDGQCFEICSQPTGVGGASDIVWRRVERRRLRAKEPFFFLQQFAFQ